MVKKDTKCWYCGKSTMEPSEELGKDWQKCSHCGTTHQTRPTIPGELGYGGTYKNPAGLTSRASQPIRR